MLLAMSKLSDVTNTVTYHLTIVPDYVTGVLLLVGGHSEPRLRFSGTTNLEGLSGEVVRREKR